MMRGAVFYDIAFVNRGPYDFLPTRLRLDLPIGPVRLDYGIPIRAERFTGEERYAPRLDAPGPGYREQRQRLYGP